jgi:transposase
MRQHSKSESLPLEEKWKGRWGYSSWLSDEAWAALEPHRPFNLPKARCVDDRLIISGTPHILKTGSRWRDCPKEYGPQAEHHKLVEGSA